MSDMFETISGEVRVRLQRGRIVVSVDNNHGEIECDAAVAKVLAARINRLLSYATDGRSGRGSCGSVMIDMQRDALVLDTDRSMRLTQAEGMALVTILRAWARLRK